MFEVIRLIALGVITPPLMYFDFRHRRLPNFFTYPFAICGFVFAIAMTSWSAILFAAVVTLFFGLLSILTNSFGMGDVKLIAGLSLWLGVTSWQSAVMGHWWGFVLAGVAALGLMLTGRSDRFSSLPMGPFLLVGAWTTIIGFIL